MRRLEETGSKNVVWFGFGNINAVLGNPQAADYLVAQPRTWKEFKTGISELEKMEEPIDAIVVDVLNQMSAKALSDNPTQADWAQMGNDVRNVLEQLRALAPNVYVVVDVLPNDEGVDKLDLNRDLYKKTISLFGTKTYCHTTMQRAAKGSKTPPKQIYVAQENGARALDLRPESR